MNREHTTRSRSRQTRGGFTLVEMLVSVALVLLIMTLFAEAFSIAASAIRKQRGVAENDQRARSLVTILLGDLQKRTYRQREDVITETLPLPADIDAANDPRLILNQVENFANRLARGIVPLHPDYFIGGGAPAMTAGQAGPAFNKDGAAPREVDSVFERGYFYYSEGDIPNDTDDVLKFTIDVSQTDLGNTDTTRLIGRAVALAQTQNPQNPPPAPTLQGVGINQNQPISDDDNSTQERPDTVHRGFRPGESGVTSSDLAEISYFVRDGKLYRRVHLIRQPLATEASGDLTGQPALPGGGPFPTFADPLVNVPEIYTTDSNGFGGLHFWLDFDHGATRFFGPSGELHMSDEASLDNTVDGDFTSGGGPFPLTPSHRFWALGDPRNRFGHDASFPPPGDLSGRPKEYMIPADPTTFIGQYTHEETSHPAFGYPGQPGFGGGPISPMQFGPVATLGLFANGPRAGEDILLGNCHAFDVKIWDDQLGRFVDMGHTLTRPDAAFGGPVLGDWHQASVVGPLAPAGPAIAPNPTPATDTVGRYQAPHWGPSGVGMVAYGGRAPGLGNRVFDTWHPAFNFTNDTKAGPPPGLLPVELPDNDPPPYRPLWSDRFNFYIQSAQVQGVPFNPPVPPPTPGNPSGIRYWQADTDYPANARVFPRPNLVGGTAPMPTHQSFFYQLDFAQSIDADDDGFFRSSDTSGNQPSWPESPGGRTSPETNSVTDDRLVWKAINNTIGLKAIQISVRFLDPTSGQMRQLTLTHSFVES